MMDHAERFRLKMVVDELSKANVAVSGIGMVLDAMLDADGNAASNCPLRGNDFVKGSLLNGLSTICLLVDYRLDDLRELGGIERAE